MNSAIRRLAIGTALACIAAGIALACGFDFPQTLLDRRQEVLPGLKPTDWASMQIEELLPKVTDALKAEEESGLTAAEAELRETDASHAPQLATMRAAPNGAAAYSGGEGLPEATRLYTAGAVEFQRAALAAEAKQDPRAQLSAALRYFQNVLRLPDEQRAARATWASYMVGRVQYLLPDPAARAGAVTAFQQTREMARKGLPDPLALAAASYGEEARIALEDGDIPHATGLYLEQAARGSAIARSSLRETGELLASKPDIALKFIGDPRIQKMWFATVLAQGPSGFYLGDANGAAQTPNSWDARVAQVAAAIDRRTTTQLDGLAAIAYSTGRFDLAASLAAGVNLPLAAVVRAKLALRNGNRAAAATEFAAAVSLRNNTPAAGNTGLSARGWSRLLAENGVLAMSRGDYAAALQNLLEAGSDHWLDAAYIAERVMTLDELTAFARQHLPLRTPADKPDPENLAWHFYYGSPPNPSRALRLLLARRQMREQHFEAALENFHHNDFAADDTHASVAALADDYIAAIKKSTRSWTRIKRAAGLFRAAQLSRQYGLELLGYELAPDNYAFGANTSLDSEPDTGSFVGPDEISRLAANPPPQTRFHYRGRAHDLANQAADQLPPRSQAFAAVLCANLRWAQSSDETEQTQLLYQRYVREAAYVAWSPQFGGRCEAPDFSRATKFMWQTRIHAARIALRPYKAPLLILFAAFVLGGWLLLRKR